MTEESLTDSGEGDSMIETGAARLVNLYASKPPKVTLSREQKKKLDRVVRKDKDFRQLKDAVRLEAWEQQLHILNKSPNGADFPTEYASAQGFRQGMLFAIDRLEALVEIEDD